MEEARDFIESLPRPVANKIYYNIRRVVDGERDADLFKKLRNKDLGIPYPLWQYDLSFVCVLGHEKGNVGGSHSRNCPKGTKNSA